MTNKTSQHNRKQSKKWKENYHQHFIITTVELLKGGRAKKKGIFKILSTSRRNSNNVLCVTKFKKIYGI